MLGADTALRLPEAVKPCTLWPGCCGLSARRTHLVVFQLWQRVYVHVVDAERNTHRSEDPRTNRVLFQLWHLFQGSQQLHTVWVQVRTDHAMYPDVPVQAGAEVPLWQAAMQQQHSGSTNKLQVPLSYAYRGVCYAMGMPSVTRQRGQLLQ